MNLLKQEGKKKKNIFRVLEISRQFVYKKRRTTKLFFLSTINPRLQCSFIYLNTLTNRIISLLKTIKTRSLTVWGSLVSELEAGKNSNRSSWVHSQGLSRKKWAWLKCNKNVLGEAKIQPRKSFRHPCKLQKELTPIGD